MVGLTIRNDDVSVETSMEEIVRFCEICDKYDAKIIHAITAVGKVRDISSSDDNDTIRAKAGKTLFTSNTGVLNYLRRRNDGIAVHGLWHTHCPSKDEVIAGRVLLMLGGLKPAWYVPPFNEFCGLTILVDLPLLGTKIPRLEEYLNDGDPSGSLVYLHSWRFHHGPFTWQQLEQCLARLNVHNDH